MQYANIVLIIWLLANNNVEVAVIELLALNNIYKSRIIARLSTAVANVVHHTSYDVAVEFKFLGVLAAELDFCGTNASTIVPKISARFSYG